MVSRSLLSLLRCCHYYPGLQALSHLERRCCASLAFVGVTASPLLTLLPGFKGFKPSRTPLLCVPANSRSGATVCPPHGVKHVAQVVGTPLYNLVKEVVQVDGTPSPHGVKQVI